METAHVRKDHEAASLHSSEEDDSEQTISIDEAIDNNTQCIAEQEKELVTLRAELALSQAIEKAKEEEHRDIIDYYNSELENKQLALCDVRVDHVKELEVLRNEIVALRCSLGEEAVARLTAEADAAAARNILKEAQRETINTKVEAELQELISKYQADPACNSSAIMETWLHSGQDDDSELTIAINETIDKTTERIAEQEKELVALRAQLAVSRAAMEAVEKKAAEEKEMYAAIEKAKEEEHRDIINYYNSELEDKQKELFDVRVDHAKELEVLRDEIMKLKLMHSACEHTIREQAAAMQRMEAECIAVHEYAARKRADYSSDMEAIRKNVRARLQTEQHEKDALKNAVAALGDELATLTMNHEEDTLAQLSAFHATQETLEKANAECEKLRFELAKLTTREADRKSKMDAGFNKEYEIVDEDECLVAEEEKNESDGKA